MRINPSVAALFPPTVQAVQESAALVKAQARAVDVFERPATAITTPAVATEDPPSFWESAAALASRIGAKIGGAIRDAAVDTFGPLWGVVQLFGIRHNVHHYEEQVNDVLWRGSRPIELYHTDDTTRLQMLKDKGIKSIVSLCLEETGEEGPAQALGFNTLNIPVLDNSSPSLEQVQTFIDYVQNPENQPVFVHCEAGVGRTGTFVACYRIAVEGYTAAEAVAEYKRFVNVPNQVRFIEAFAESL